MPIQQALSGMQYLELFGLALFVSSIVLIGVLVVVWFNSKKIGD